MAALGDLSPRAQGLVWGSESDAAQGAGGGTGDGDGVASLWERSEGELSCTCGGDRRGTE